MFKTLLWLENQTACVLIFILRMTMKSSTHGQKFTLAAISWLTAAVVKPANITFMRLPWLYKLANLPHRIATHIAWELQEDVAQLSNLKRCEYCTWVIYSDHPHEYCDSVLSQPDTFSDDWAASDQDDPNEICLCGHRRSAHFYDEGCCLSHNCNCPDFGTSLEEWYQPTQVWFTEPPGGHNAWE